MNSARNKLELLKPIISESVDILVVAETKLDSSLQPTNSLLMSSILPTAMTAMVIVMVF